MRKILIGWILWKAIALRYRIDQYTVIIFLTGDNKTLDLCCIEHLQELMDRKRLGKGVVFSFDLLDEEHFKGEMPAGTRQYLLKKGWMELVYEYYKFVRFSDNIVFTYTDYPKDNYLGRYLRETGVTEEDAACLALYHLRSVPEKI